MAPIAALWAAVYAIAVGAALADECPNVTTQPDFDLDAFISKRWYVQQQIAVSYLPASQNSCVYAEYSKLAKPTFWGFTVQVHNFAQEPPLPFIVSFLRS